MNAIAEEDRALLALAAVFAPAAAPSLAARLAADPGDALRSALVRAATRPRGERLAALGVALDGARLEEESTARVEAIAARERAPIAEALRAVLGRSSRLPTAAFGRLIREPPPPAE